MPNWFSKAWQGFKVLGAAKSAPTPPAAKPKGSSVPAKSTGAGMIADPPPPKVKPGQQSLPSYLKTANPLPGMRLPMADTSIVSTDLETYRGGADTRTVVHDFANASPDLSAAVNAFLRTSITKGYTAVAKNMDGTFNRDATSLLQQLLTRFDVVQDYSDGFSGISSLRSTSESLAKELLYYGSCSLELVLGKDRLPRQLQPISVVQVIFFPDKSGKWLAPQQYLAGVYTDLDIPTFFYTALDQDLLQAYSQSPLESALQPVLFSAEFMNDLRRIIKRVVHPRLLVEIDEEKVRAGIPPEVAADSDKLAAYFTTMISTIENQVNGLNPEDALVYFNSLGFTLIGNANSNLDAEYKVLSEIVDAKMATGAKALPSILGHGSGSQNVASSETLLFMKNSEGMVQLKLNEIYSRALTLAVRLFGQDVYVEFKYDEIDLRPSLELEAFRALKQSRLLSLLSYGFITDDEASMALTGQLTPAGFKTLSGTQFMQPQTTSGRPDGAQNPYNGSGGAGGGQGGGGAGTQKNNEPPKGVKGGQKKAEDDAELRLV